MNPVTYGVGERGIPHIVQYNLAGLRIWTGSKDKTVFLGILDNWFDIEY